MLKNPHTSHESRSVVNHDHGDEDIFARAKQLWGDLRSLQSKTAATALALGRELIAIKDNIPHGEWEPHVEEHVGVPPRTASYYMKLAREHDDLPEEDKSAILADLDELNIIGLERFLANNKNASRRNRRPRICGNGGKKNDEDAASPMYVELYDEFTDFLETFVKKAKKLTPELQRELHDDLRDWIDGISMPRTAKWW